MKQETELLFGQAATSSPNVILTIDARQVKQWIVAHSSIPREPASESLDRPKVVVAARDTHPRRPLIGKV
ncbi:MAG: hypothetical protein AABP62_05210 [Planctomycetota bacterium]